MNQWMTEWKRTRKKTLFYEGSGEYSRTFYIQPSPVSETTINRMDTLSYNKLSTRTFTQTMLNGHQKTVKTKLNNGN